MLKKLLKENSIIINKYIENILNIYDCESLKSYDSKIKKKGINF
jgi:hypothetical protein